MRKIIVEIEREKAEYIERLKGAELEAEYKLAVQEIEKLYIPETIKKHKYNWMLPNNSTKLEISIMCNCEIEGVENEKN